MNHLSKYRQQIKLTQKGLADQSGVTQQQISYLENGKRSADRQSLEDCRALASALASAGAVNDAGEPVSLDDVFPPADSETAAA